ncbi:MAG: hypothetical protein QGG40_09625, partial [Myxococcota bacterium]|nr:hypothetical protein [Myxococcota bacterium]
MTPITGTVNRLRLAATFALFVSAGCSGKEDLPFTGGGSYSNPSSSGDDTSTDDTGDADDTGDTSDSGEPTDDTGEWEMDQLDGVGDIVEFNDIDASTDVDLSDEDEESNKDQEFYLILYNTAEDGMGYSLEYRELEEEEEEEEEEQARIAPSQSHPPDEPEARQRLQDAIDAGELGPARRAGPVPPPWDDEDIGVQSASYRVRTDLNDETAYADVQATLVTYGENVAFWLDDDVAMDWDTDCDGSVDEDADLDGDGFTNCAGDCDDTNV